MALYPEVQGDCVMNAPGQGGMMLLESVVQMGPEVGMEG
jgi:hypothetical protein